MRSIYEAHACWLGISISISTLFHAFNTIVMPTYLLLHANWRNVSVDDVDMG
ncbi:hypothetical protein P692DRAFT_20824521 [Suillus brevipes Sb2]|nr:hypothetical protein P692DRAFT_20824521 [Suillus brevipes Sb2]